MSLLWNDEQLDQDEIDAIKAGENPSASNPFITEDDLLEVDLQTVTNNGNTTTNDINIQGAAKGLKILRPDGSVAGGVVENNQDQYGLVVGGFDEESNLTNVALAGSNIYFGTQNQYIANNAALPHGYLKLGGDSVTDDNGNEFYPLAFQQIEQELYSEEFLDINVTDVSDGLEHIILTSTALVNGYSDPANFEYSFRVQELGNKSTEIEYFFKVDGVPTTKERTVIGSDTLVTVVGSAQIQTLVSSGSVIELVVKALNTGGSRQTIIRGDDSATTIRLRQLGFGVYNDDSVGVIQGIGILVEPTNNGAIIYFDPSAGNIIETLGSAKDYFNKTFILKRITNGNNFVKLSPAIGEFIDDIDDTQAIVMGQSNDVLSIHSDGFKWHITQRATVCWGNNEKNRGDRYSSNHYFMD